MMIAHLLGAVSRVGDDRTPYGHRDAPFIINIVSMWQDTTRNEENIKWARDLWNAVQPFAKGGVYVNFLMTEGADGGVTIRFSSKNTGVVIYSVISQN